MMTQLNQIQTQQQDREQAIICLEEKLWDCERELGDIQMDENKYKEARHHLMMIIGMLCGERK